MSDETPQGAAPTPAPAEPVEEPRTVPYDRFQEVNKQAKEYRSQLEALEGRLAEIEDRDKSEVERERAQREKYEHGYKELQNRLTVMERSSWIRSAAAEAGFDDPEDAVAFINPSKVETEDQAEKEVKRLAKRKPKLLRDAAPPAQIGQVLQNGQAPQQTGDPAMDAQAEEFMRQVQAAQQSGWISIPVNEI